MTTLSYSSSSTGSVPWEDFQAQIYERFSLHAYLHTHRSVLLLFFFIILILFCSSISILKAPPAPTWFRSLIHLYSYHHVQSFLSQTQVKYSYLSHNGDPVIIVTLQQFTRNLKLFNKHATFLQLGIILYYSSCSLHPKY